MKWLNKWFRRWIAKGAMNDAVLATAGPPDIERTRQSGDFRIAVQNAMNGKVLEISTYKPNQRGPDWTTELFVVPEGENLKDALTMLLLLKGL
jgi:hypothetical protein